MLSPIAQYYIGYILLPQCCLFQPIINLLSNGLQLIDFDLDILKTLTTMFSKINQTSYMDGNLVSQKYKYTVIGSIGYTYGQWTPSPL